MSTDVASNAPENLLRAFSATDYRVRVDGREFVVRPGRRHAQLDAALGDRPWAILTAHNPGARRVDEAGNRARHQRLLDTLAQRRLEAHPGVNRDPAGGWPDEPSVLIVDPGLEELDALAELFGQAAAVTGRSGDMARLRFYGKDWPRPLPEWAEGSG